MYAQENCFPRPNFVCYVCRRKSLYKVSVEPQKRRIGKSSRCDLTYILVLRQELSGIDTPDVFLLLLLPRGKCFNTSQLRIYPVAKHFSQFHQEQSITDRCFVTGPHFLNDSLLSQMPLVEQTSHSVSRLFHILLSISTPPLYLWSLFSGRDALKTEHHSLPQAFSSVITGLQPPMFCSHLPMSTFQSYSCFSPQHHAIDSSLCCSLAAPPSYT